MITRGDVNLPTQQDKKKNAFNSRIGTGHNLQLMKTQKKNSSQQS